ncbi:MAG: phospholipase D-like domain-containing protein [Bacteroidales bacterium]|jgi:cardiolipin synthase|nr:phospholipase D-like domain-containing protein [Bacteroidales bacterium]
MKTQLFDNNVDFFLSILNDIEHAKHAILIEMYRITNDEVGERLTEALIEKCKQGVEVRLLLDAYGSMQFENLAKRIQEHGGHVRFFKKLKLFLFNTFLKNNSRNHRKLIIIDDNIVYFGSSNLTSYSHVWRDLNLRVEGEFAAVFKPVFEKSYELHKFYDFNFFERIKPVVYEHFRIIQDRPSNYSQSVKNHFLYLIRNAKSEIIIETPYFLPGYDIRHALMNAAKKRGVSVKLLIPQYSDVRTVDLLRNKYLGQLHKSGVQLLFYTPNNLHAKCVLVDNRRFSVGSSNFDYRSFRYQFEMMVSGKDQEVIKLLSDHLHKTEAQCIPFDYNVWKHRGNITKFMEWLMFPFRKLF